MPHLFTLKSAVISSCLAGVFALAGCGLFSTREPEPPTGGSQSFVPPTSPALVVENFKTAVKEKNAENFALCMADTTRGDRSVYRFEPAAEVAARYAALFSGWDAVTERQSFISLMSKIPNDTPPSLTFTGGRFDVITQDSAVFLSDYLLLVNHTVASVPTRAGGSIRLTIIPNSGGQWSISRWSDANPATADTNTTTWSAIKAQFSN